MILNSIVRIEYMDNVDANQNIQNFMDYRIARKLGL